VRVGRLHQLEGGARAGVEGLAEVVVVLSEERVGFLIQIALLTRPVRVPYRTAAASTMTFAAPGSDRSASDAHHGRRHGLERLHRRGERRAVDVGDEELGAALGQRLRDAQAHTSGGAGDDDGVPEERSGM